MTKRTSSLLAIACCSLVFCAAPPALSKPVTRAELSGKKICWNTGDVSTYYSSGKYNSSQWGDGTWSLSAVGVDLRVTTGSTLETVEKFADGTYKAVYEYQGGRTELTGRECK